MQIELTELRKPTKLETSLLYTLTSIDDYFNANGLNNIRIANSELLEISGFLTSQTLNPYQIVRHILRYSIYGPFEFQGYHLINNGKKYKVSRTPSILIRDKNNLLDNNNSRVGYNFKQFLQDLKNENPSIDIDYGQLRVYFPKTNFPHPTKSLKTAYLGPKIVYKKQSSLR